ncbi:MAG: class I SAM-dependent methyltransferase [Desulfobacterales bacterium]
MTDRGFHLITGRLEASILNSLESIMDRVYGSRKRALFREFPLDVVEIGPGPGANFRYYRPGTRLLAVEPKGTMHPLLRRNARRYGIRLEIRAVKGEAIDLPDACVDAVVGTLVLCSVDTPSRVVQEIRRILRPGGRYVFLEHVAAPPGTVLGGIQNRLHKPWHWLFQGCHLNRSTHELLLNSGFSSIDMNCFALNAFAPFTPHIIGQAIA